jgi:hypothetical protein
MRPPAPHGPGRLAIALLGLASLATPGCTSGGLETSYGRARGKSLNGTGVVADLLREAGHEVRSAVRLTGELDDWADVIVRFAPRPGPPARDEADWYLKWLSHGGERRVVYVPRDYDAQAEYWTAVLDGLAKDAPADEKARARKLRDEAKGWVSHLPTAAKEAAPPEDWFAVEVPKPNLVKVCKALGGPWAHGIDPAKAAVPRHDTLKVESETVLLTGDDRPLAIEWTHFNGSRVLVVANGSFLLNAALVNPARRALAGRAIAWAGAGETPRKVAFVEGPYVIGEEPGMPSVFHLLRVPPFGWVAAQMLALGLAACLARAPRLGRARPEPPSGEDRPAAHPEALGALLARTDQADQARAQLDAYHQWRKKSAPVHPPHSG